MRILAQTLADLPKEQLEGLAAYIVGFLTDDAFQERSAFLGIPPSKDEILQAIQEWIVQEKVLN